MSTKSNNYATIFDSPPLPDPLPPQALPMQPQPIPLPQPFPQPVPLPIKSLRCGCYLVNYKPNGSPLVSYDGTIRVECHSNGRTASGDLYQRRIIFLPPPPPPLPIPLPILLPGPNPANGIPILPRSRYRYYLRITQLLENFTFGNSFTLGFEMWRFTAPNSWVNEGAFTAVMTWKPAPAGYPSSGNYLDGDVKNAANAIVGRLTMGWVSKYLRKATVEIDQVSVSEAPLDSGAGHDWNNVFENINWDVTLDISDSNVAQPSGDSWSNAEMHAAMLARRDSSDLDSEWRYHVLAVKLLDATPRGIMYDNGATDSNNVPREGIGISSHWVIPNADPWGLVKGQRFGVAKAPYFRTAVHEIGHALGLFHNTVDNGFMNTTDVIAASPGGPFPNNIKWAFADDDKKRLRHYPDVYVRSGGTAFGTASTTTPPISPTDLSQEMDGLELSAVPLLASVPIGAPVRVNIELVNTSDGPIFAPATLSMFAGLVKGTVTDPSGTTRTFLPLVRCLEEVPLETLEPGKSISHSITLLRGREGALFPAPGAYRVVVEAHWDMGGIEACVTGEANVMVTSAVDETHAAAALKILSTPDALLTLVFGGDHLTDGMEAIQTALSCSTLRPHFAYTEAKRIGQRFGKRKANLKQAAALLEESTVMSPAEVKSAAEFVKAAGDGEGTSTKHIAKMLQGKMKAMAVSDEVKAAVDAL